MSIPKMVAFIFSVISLFSSHSLAHFHDHYLSIDAAIAGANGEVTNDIASLSLEYQKRFDHLRIFPTAQEYHWYLDAAVTTSFFEVEDPVRNIGITGTSLETADLTATDIILELGFTRRQKVYDTIFWTLGTRGGFFSINTDNISGQTNGAQDFNVTSKSAWGLTISAHSGVSWNISENWLLDFMLQLRKHYLNEFKVRDTISGGDYKYHDFTSIGFSLGVARGF